MISEKLNLLRKPHKHIARGDTVQFGRYPQEAAGKVLPIKWKVLNIENGIALLISEKCLVRSAYFDFQNDYAKTMHLTWELSMAREICNGYFYHKAFSSYEHSFIIAKRMQSGDETYTFDNVFLLTEDEVCSFLPQKEDRQAVPSDYLLAKKDKSEKILLGFNDEEKFTSWWLLPEKESEKVYYPKAVWPSGEIQYHGRNIYHHDFTIRPCVMVKITEKFEKMCRLMQKDSAPEFGGEAYSLEYIRSFHNSELGKKPGERTSFFDSSLRKWRMRIRLDDKGQWYLSVFRYDNGIFDKYSLDNEVSNDSHYEFSNEKAIRKVLSSRKDSKEYFAEVLIRYVEKHGGDELLKKIRPFITKEYHF